MEALPAILAAKEVGVGPVKPNLVWLVPSMVSIEIDAGSIPPREAILSTAFDTGVPGVKITVR